MKVFVYGTLKPGYINYRRYCAHKTTAEQPAIAFGQLYALPIGYPAMTLGTEPVHGFVFTFADAAILRTLDVLEQYHPDRPSGENEYQRHTLEVFDQAGHPLGEAWVYLMLLERVQQVGGILLESGTWTGDEHQLEQVFLNR